MPADSDMFEPLPRAALTRPFTRQVHDVIFSLATVLFVAATTFHAQSATVGVGALGKLTVRVEAPPGAPRLVVNGRPVRARMFFGGAGSAPLKIDPIGRSVEFEFTAENDSQDRGTLHFRFGQTPGDVFLDNIRIEDLTVKWDVAPVSDFEGGSNSFAQAWTFWPPGDANTVGRGTLNSLQAWRARLDCT